MFVESLTVTSDADSPTTIFPPVVFMFEVASQLIGGLLGSSGVDGIFQ